MTKMIYDVIRRPRVNIVGRTNVGWAAETMRKAVPLGGYLITTRTLLGEKKKYTAMVCMPKKNETGQTTVVDTLVGTEFETRASAAFAIWRKYYEDWRAEQVTVKVNALAVKDFELKSRRVIRDAKKAYRKSPEGKEAFLKIDRQRAKLKRDSKTIDQRAEAAAKRRQKRAEDKYWGA